MPELQKDFCLSDLHQPFVLDADCRLSERSRSHHAPFQHIPKRAFLNALFILRFFKTSNRRRNSRTGETMKPKYTPWFDPVTQPPVHVGWWPVKWRKVEAFWQRQFNCPRMHWNGSAWSDVVIKGDDESTVRIAYKARDSMDTWQHQDFKWRGLTAPHPEYKGGVK